jgi:hypothetical protein
MPLQRGSSPRYKIKILSKQLRRLTFPTSPITVKHATFAADAFDRFLSQKCNSLDEAFGLEKVRGAPRKLSKAKQRRALAMKIFALRLTRKTWYQIEDELGQDAGLLRRIYIEFKPRLMRRELLRQLNLSDEATSR